MFEFITTKGIAYHIEELVKKAEKEITLVTPYLKISPLLLERIIEHDRKGLITTIIYGKDDLRIDQAQALKKLNNLNLYFLKNLHAKCYFNERQMLITSMNLHEFSENNNREFGIVVDSKKEKSFYSGVIQEVESIKASAILQHQSKRILEVKKTALTYLQFDNKVIASELFRALKSKYPSEGFQINDGLITADDLLGLGVDYSNQYGFAMLEIQDNDHNRHYWLKNNYYDKMQYELRDYRVFWSNPFYRINIYHQNDKEFLNIEEVVRYCLKGLDLIIPIVRKMNILPIKRMAASR